MPPERNPDWAAQLDGLLPQTQCTRCGEPDCARYAKAIAVGAPINRCPPGGAEGIGRLAALTGHPIEALDPACGQEGPRSLAWIDEAACIGCTLCIKACPVDCIVGAPRQMHTVVEAWCTGCELCLPACPVDCIHLEVATPGASGWAAWSQVQANDARRRYQARGERLARADDDRIRRLEAQGKPAPGAAVAVADTPEGDARRATLAAALAKARALRRP